MLPAKTLDRDDQNFLRSIFKSRPVYLPSSSPTYSNVGFQLLALVVERIKGGSFGAVLDHDVFRRLNMTSSSLGAPFSVHNAVIPINETFSGWAKGRSNESKFVSRGLHKPE